MSGCEGYSAIADVYDRLNKEIDYGKWADFFDKCFDRFLPARPELVLDLACGTGRMTRELASRGYDMIGVDGSEDMLAEAYNNYDNYDKYNNSEGSSVLYLCQDMRGFELYGTVGAVVCCLDSVNYLLTNDDLKKCFSLVHNYLDPDGLFLFDVNTPYKFEKVYGDNAYILEDEVEEDGESYGVFCGWQNEYDRETKICDFYLSVFKEDEDGGYYREDEHQRERMYELDELKMVLGETGFELLGVFSDYNFSDIREDTERWYIAAKAKK